MVRLEMSVLRQSISRRIAGTLSHPSKSPSTSRTLFTRTAPSPRSPIRTGLYATVFALSTGLFAVYYFDARSALHRYFLTPILRHTLDAETGHKVAVKVLRSGLGPKDPLLDDARLKVEVRIVTT